MCVNFYSVCFSQVWKELDVDKIFRMVNPSKAFHIANENTYGWEGEAELLI